MDRIKGGVGWGFYVGERQQNEGTAQVMQRGWNYYRLFVIIKIGRLGL